jgi:hypothetical protein
MSGVSLTANGANTGIVVDELNFTPADETGSTTRLTYDGNRNLAGLSINTPHSNVSFGASEINCGAFGACGAINTTSLAVVMDPFENFWDYQSFGVWLKDITPTSFQLGAMSAGAMTPASALPTSLLTDVTFSGHAGGFFINQLGQLFATDAPMTAVVNFSAQRINFRTDATLVTDPTNPLATPVFDNGLNLTGTWNYPAGTSQFSGTVTTQNGLLAGNASGRFYGPAAEEIGGVYGLSSTPLETSGKSRMIGGFGGRRF